MKILNTQHKQNKQETSHFNLLQQLAEFLGILTSKVSQLDLRLGLSGVRIRIWKTDFSLSGRGVTHNEEPEHIIPVEGFDISDTGAAYSLALRPTWPKGSSSLSFALRKSCH